MLHLFYSFLSSVALLGYTRATGLQIAPGAAWTASNYGRHIQAHGAGIIKVDNTYYMIGEDKTNGTEFQNVNCFLSTNLVEWTYVGALLSQTSGGDLGPGRVVERPKVIYNNSTRKYVLYMHIDSMDYQTASVGIATGDSVCGKYNYIRSFRPQDNQSRDIGLYQEADGTAYLLSEDRPNGLHIYKLSSDYLTIDSLVYTWHESIESPAMFKRDNTYFVFGSHLSGWDPNDNIYSTATSLAGPWSAWDLFAGTNGTNTFNSQTTYILPVSEELVIYMGDRWFKDALMTSTYIWLPLEIDGTKVTMHYQDHWVLDQAAGRWAPSVCEDVFQAQNAGLLGGAKITKCSGCTGGEAAGWIGGPNNGAAVFSNVSVNEPGERLVRIFAPNGDSTERFANLCVNGGGPHRVAFLPTTDAGTPGVSSVVLSLNKGPNTIKIEGIDGGWGPDVDRIQLTTH